MNGKDGGTRVVREGGMEAIRHVTFPQCIKGTGLSVTHTVRMGRGGGDGGEERGREGQREEEKETERKRMRKRER